MARIHLIESQFDRILSILTEGAETLSAIHDKWYSDIPENEFMKIVSSDPTYRQDKGNKMGKYGKWLLGLYKKGSLKLEDLYKATEYLTCFNKYINKIEQKDVMKYPDLPSLYSAVEPFMNNDVATSKSDEIRRLKKDVKKVYEDNEWLILIPLTKEASIYYGKNTQWCTAAEHSNNRFNEYNTRGHLYININKQTNRKYQFHFETSSFMDENDRAIQDPIAETIGMDEKVVQAAYPQAIETLLVDSEVVALGDGLYYDNNKYYVYRLYDAGMFQSQLGYERKKIVENADPDYCLKLSKNIWWFKKYRETHGYFYNILNDSIQENKDYTWLNVFKHPKTGRPFIYGYCKFNNNSNVRTTFIGHMNGDEIVIDTRLNSSSFDTMEEILEGYYVDDSSMLKRYIVIKNGNSDAHTNEDSFDLYDIVKMCYVVRNVVTTGIEYDAKGKEYVALRDSISSEEIYERAEQMAMENYDEDEEVDYYEASDEYWGEILDDFLEYQAKKYLISLEDGEMYDSSSLNMRE